ncbi:aminodeoxychorismate lyase [Halalkalibacter wakoensis JCM 9140]|uniref:aminodeoxychorismate lyase n=1 Tax=Halalkalibacter wakoensis JCM 9140 TaxID=1236970 RepID=W4Q7F8_9BACI|nr:aminodeoxychorismate lyase [Halalkalibacter wakoensis]GAE28001.1 aminodeoxychorismate lyase [Halalkalibacter wakoensis JCM 9140]
MFVYVNGQILKKEEARISAFDHGYMYGLGLFETFRVDDGHPFLLDDHFQRLQEGLRTMGISWAMNRDEIMEILTTLLEANGLKSAYVRWNVSAGPHDVGLYTGEYEEPTVIVYMKPLPSFQGITKTAKVLDIRRNTPEGQVRLKSHHYLNNVLAKRELGEDGTVEGIFLTESGFVAEGVVSNLFWVKDEVVYTPSVETGILNGVTRQFVLALLEKEGIKWEAGFFRPNDLSVADEVFITNSIQEVIPIRSFNETNFIGDKPITNKLKLAFDYYRHCLRSRTELKGEKR